MGEVERLRELVDASWERDMQDNPEWATIVGHPGRHVRWTDLSFEAIDARNRDAEERLTALHAIDRGQLGGDDQVTYDLFERDVRDRIDAIPFRDELQPLNQLMGPQQDPAMVIAAMPATTDDDRDAIVERLGRIAELVDQSIELMDAGLRLGITPPQICLRDVPDQVANQLVDDPTKSPLVEAVHDREDAAAVYTESIRPAYERLLAYLTETYIPAARETIAARDLPDGDERYAFKVRMYTTTDLTPQEIHDIGLAEVDRIGTAMRQVIADVGFDGGFTEFAEFIRTDPQFFFERADDLIAGYRDLTIRIDPELPKLFGRLPRQPYAVEPVPAYAEKSQTAAYYLPGAPDGSRPGTFFANTYDLAARPKWEMEALTLHEAVPGHHLQIALAQELEDLPDFRRHAWFTAYGEGWGLYAESLGEELGLYRDAYSRYGAFNGEIWRAIRLVVDTGLHALGWSRQQAIDYFYETSGRTDHDVVVEVDRYIVWPGQALAYKIGELKLKDLRARAASALGENFDVRAFHDEVLRHGCLPLDILERQVEAWIETTRSALR